MDSEGSRGDMDALVERLQKIEHRIARIETRLELEEPEDEQSPVTAVDEEALDEEVGQSWFAKAGIVVIGIGMALVLTLPFDGITPVIPSIIGVALAAGIYGLSHLWRSSLVLISNYLRGASLLLTFFATLRLYFFGELHALSTGSLWESIPLSAVVALCFIVALRRESRYLSGLAYVTGFIAVMAVDHTLLGFIGLAALAGGASTLHALKGWTSVYLTAIVGTYLTYLNWSLNNPLIGHTPAFVASGFVSLAMPIVLAVMFAAGQLRRTHTEEETLTDGAAAFLNGGGGVAVFLVHALASDAAGIVSWSTAVSVIFLALATLFWVRESSRYSTFIYAMLGYAMLSVAILKAFASPGVFLWLSLQSIVVVATAIWFRSRFIVVGNFFIFITIVAGYLAVSSVEEGIMIVFGLVALASARILNWQQERLALQTVVMRNAYLVLAFAAMPYGLSGMVPQGAIAVAWVGLAIFYYGMNQLIRNQKYLWMAHLTLMLTVLYVLIIGIIQLDAMFRIVSFLTLGVVLLAVSVIYTRRRIQKGRSPQSA